MIPTRTISEDAILIPENLIHPHEHVENVHTYNARFFWRVRQADHVPYTVLRDDILKWLEQMRWMAKTQMWMKEDDLGNICYYIDLGAKTRTVLFKLMWC